MLERSCDVCRTTGSNPLSGVCERCGSTLNLDERRRAALLEDLRERVSAGLRSAVTRSHRCSHDCPYVSLYVLVAAHTKYSGAYRRCAYLWFVEEYPPDNQVTHEMFQYPP